MESRGSFERVLTIFSILLVAYSTIFDINSNTTVQDLPEAAGSGAKKTNITQNFFNSSNSTDSSSQSVVLPSKHPVLEKNDVIYSTKRTLPPIVNEEYKVIFFHVAKAASSEWIRFFTRLSGNPAWCGKNVHHTEVNKLKRLSDYSLKEAQRLMTDPSWTRAIFVRHPKKRILSAFLDKAVSRTKKFAIDYCNKFQLHGGDFNYCVEHHEEFEFFLYNITTVSPDNVHWRPIYTRIDEKFWPYINYIANMENLSNDAMHFLQSINSTIDGVSAWDRIGKKGWSENERDCNTMGENAFLQKKDEKLKTNEISCNSQ